MTDVSIGCLLSLGQCDEQPNSIHTNSDNENLITINNELFTNIMEKHMCCQYEKLGIPYSIVSENEMKVLSN